MQNHWIDPIVELGVIKPKSSKQLRFVALPTMPDVKEIIASCGCTKFKFYPKERELQITYNAGEIPKHLGNEQKVNKKITIVYRNGEEDTIYIRGVKRK